MKEGLPILAFIAHCSSGFIGALLLFESLRLLMAHRFRSLEDSLPYLWILLLLSLVIARLSHGWLLDTNIQPVPESLMSQLASHENALGWLIGLAFTGLFCHLSSWFGLPERLKSMVHRVPLFCVVLALGFSIYAKSVEVSILSEQGRLPREAPPPAEMDLPGLEDEF